jgi:hypothetical protein
MSRAGVTGLLPLARIDLCRHRRHPFASLGNDDAAVRATMMPPGSSGGCDACTSERMPGIRLAGRNDTSGWQR